MCTVASGRPVTFIGPTNVNFCPLRAPPGQLSNFCPRDDRKDDLTAIASLHSRSRTSRSRVRQVRTLRFDSTRLDSTASSSPLTRYPLLPPPAFPEILHIYVCVSMFQRLPVPESFRPATRYFKWSLSRAIVPL